MTIEQLELRKWAVEQALALANRSPEVRYIEIDANCLLNYIHGGSFFFAQDADSLWYKIPSQYRGRWDYLNRSADVINSVNAGATPLTQDEIDDAINNEFSKYRADGGISHFNFYVI